MSSHLTASASGVHSTIRNRNTNGMFIMYMPQMFDKSFSVRARIFLLYEGSLRHNKILLAGPGVHTSQPLRGCTQHHNAAGNPAPTASGSIPYFLIFFKTLKNYGFHILHWLLSEGVKSGRS